VGCLCEVCQKGLACIDYKGSDIALIHCCISVSIFKNLDICEVKFAINAIRRRKDLQIWSLIFFSTDALGCVGQNTDCSSYQRLIKSHTTWLKGIFFLLWGDSAYWAWKVSPPYLKPNLPSPLSDMVVHLLPPKIILVVPDLIIIVWYHFQRWRWFAGCICDLQRCPGSRYCSSSFSEFVSPHWDLFALLISSSVFIQKGSQ
jgi:hypothetical protein